MAKLGLITIFVGVSIKLIIDLFKKISQVIFNLRDFYFYTGRWVV